MELIRALAVLAESPDRPEVARLAAVLELGEQPSASDYTETFVFQHYPYASVYLGAEGMLGGEARDRVAGFWRALGLVPPTEPDYLPVMLSLYARLCELENNERVDAPRAAEHWRVARKAFLWEHLLAWLPAYLTKLSETAPPFYARWSSLLQEALTEEAREIGPQGTLPLHLRAASCMSDPRGAGGGTEEFLQTLLAPARSGMLLTRSDLGRAARTLGLGSRIGERKFILKALLGQNARSTLGWLAGEAARWAKRHRAQPPVFRSVSDWWAARAENTASLLDELGATADEEKW